MYRFMHGQRKRFYTQSVEPNRFELSLCTSLVHLPTSYFTLSPTPNVSPRVCLLNRRDIASAPPGASCTSKNELKSIVSFLILVPICSAS